jgi:hypothetical protein
MKPSVTSSVSQKVPSISQFFAWVEANSKSLEFLCEGHLYARGFSVFCPGGLFVTLYLSFSADMSVSKCMLFSSCYLCNVRNGTVALNGFFGLIQRMLNRKKGFKRLFMLDQFLPRYPQSCVSLRLFHVSIDFF